MQQIDTAEFDAAAAHLKPAASVKLFHDGKGGFIGTLGGRAAEYFGVPDGATVRLDQKDVLRLTFYPHDRFYSQSEYARVENDGVVAVQRY